jgi:nucleoid-associated protein YgaU
MATKKKSKSVSKKKTAASKKSKSAPSKKTSKKTAKKAAKKTARKSTRKSSASGSRTASSAASFDAPASDSYMDREFAAASSASSPSSYTSTSPSYGSSEEEGKGSLFRLGALVVLAVVLIVLLYMQFTGKDNGDVANNGNQAPAVEEPAPSNKAQAPASAEEDVAPASAKLENEKPAAEPAPAVGGAAKTYTVKAGDTLWGVAQAQMGNGNLWQKIYDANKLTSRSLTAGQELVIPAQ